MTMERLQAPPLPTPRAGLRALQALILEQSILASLEVVHQEMGDVFQLALPGFKPVVLVGPEANRFVLISARDELRWRPERDPVTNLLRHGVLVVDGDEHQQLRRLMNPALHRRMLTDYAEMMIEGTDQVMAGWSEERPLDMLVEMREIALLILMRTLFKVDLTPDLEQLWPSILRLLTYISPGPWLIWRGIPRPGYKRARQQIDDYLFRIIRTRRANVGEADDLLGILVSTPGMSDDLIRDQLLTMLIAGHDTSTALLAWALYLLGRHPEVMSRLQAEIEAVLDRRPPTLDSLGELTYLDQVVKETLRLYPPIHLGSRTSATDLEFQGYAIPAGTRVLYSIYLTHRHPDYWPQPERFDPERFTAERNRARPHYVYLPFGGGPRNCIGFAFAQVEARLVLARILQKFDLTLSRDKVQLRMGATLEPGPGVLMAVKKRSKQPFLPIERHRPLKTSLKTVQKVDKNSNLG